MAPQSEEEQLASAWRALSGAAEGSGWKAIDIFRSGNCCVMAGRGSENEESLLVGVAGISVPNESLLPRGRGFSLIPAKPQDSAPNYIWLALVRQQGGPLPLFSLMTADLVVLLKSIEKEDGSRISSSFTARISAWQDFMKRDHSGLLSAEEEVGLIGELVILGNLITDGMTASNAIESWAGPEDGLHDFVIGTGCIEAKTTASPTGFIAKIGSLDQLDNSLHQPLYVGAVRLTQAPEGRTLPELIATLMNNIGNPATQALLSSKLVAAGYINAMHGKYVRRFLQKELSYRLVNDSSPRLTRANVPASIMEARYSLDIDAIPVTATTFSEIYGKMGITE